MTDRNLKGTKAEISHLTENKKRKKGTSRAYIFASKAKDHVNHDSLTFIKFQSHHKCNIHNQSFMLFWHN